MSLLKKIGTRFAAVAAAMALAFGGVVMASPAYASPQNPNPPVFSSPSSSGVMPANTSFTAEGTAEPGATLWVRLMSYADTEDEVGTIQEAFVSVDSSGKWSAQGVSGGPGTVGVVAAYLYMEDLATVEDHYDGELVSGLAVRGFQMVNYVTASEEVDVPVIAPLIGTVAALVGLASIGFLGLRRKEIV